MSNERLDRLETALRRVAKEIVLHGERLNRLEEASKTLDKLGALDDRLTQFAEDVEAARRERKLGDIGFKENRETLQNHEARLLKVEREIDDDSR